MTLARFTSLFRICLTIALLSAGTVWADAWTVLYPTDCPQAQFAVADIQSALEYHGQTVACQTLTKGADLAGGSQIVMALADNADLLARMQAAGGKPTGELKSESFCILVTSSADKATIWIFGGDAAGLMYGGLETAELIRIGGPACVRAQTLNPYMAMRGTKFNIPLDVRTPSYTDVCDAAQQNIGEMWSFDFWRDYIDHLARYRYNFVSLWSLHPFPSLVKVPEYPDVALDDVQRSTVQWQENYSLNGNGFDAPEILNNVEVLKRMTIDDKIAFWRKVMDYGKQRNVRFYVVTWNIFVNGTGGKYGITDDIDNPVTADYFRQSVKQMFLTYPELAGIGLTTGENMPGSGFEAKEDWAFKTYAQGVLDAAAEQPGRKFTFIHRQHMTGARDIARTFAPLIEHPDIDFIFSFKYAKAHVFSATTQPFHEGFVEDIGDLKTIWTLRNDDNYYFRWGSPEFVREFMENIPYDPSQGFYYGSDQYIWGREFLSLEPESPRQIELAKHWYHWMIWGRLGYDPKLPSDRFEQILKDRYPTLTAPQGQDAWNGLKNAWEEASQIYPLTTGFHWGSLDFQWYIEACKSQPGPAQTESGFHDVNRFITLPPHKCAGCMSIPDYVDSLRKPKAAKPDGMTPLEVAAALDRHADQTLALLRQLDHGGDKELRLTMADIQCMAYLGKYYAHKIRGATLLHQAREMDQDDCRKLAAEQLNRAADYWRLYASTAMGQYKNPLWTNRVGHVDWRKLMQHVLNDVVIAGGTPALTSMQPTAGGIIVEAESADSVGMTAVEAADGNTGSGYLVVKDDAKARAIEWTIEAPQAGTYLLEFRYAADQDGEYPCPLSVNGQTHEPLVAWTTGGSGTWAWDRRATVLRKGENSIRLEVNDPLRVDHLNVLPAEQEE